MKRALNVLFGGDLSFSGIFKTKVIAEKTVFSPEVQAIFKSADFVVANLEGPVTSEALAAHSTVDLRQPVNTMDYFKRYCNPVLNLANNHSLDCGLPGLRETKRHIQSAAVRSFGAAETPGNPAPIEYLSNGAVDIALIAVLLPGEYADETASKRIFTLSNSGNLKRQIEEASAKADWVILNIHGGEEYTRFPSPRRRRLLRQLAAIKGLHIIVAHHSHVFQGIEKVDGTLIFYSLGNFIFHLEKHSLFPATRQSALLQFQFTKNTFRYDLHPIETDWDGGVLKSASPDFLNEIERRSDFSVYYRNWMREAHAVLFAASGQTETREQPALREKTALRLLLSTQFYKRGLTILRDAQKRSFYLSALLYRFLKKTGFIN